MRIIINYSYELLLNIWGFIMKAESNDIEKYYLSDKDMKKIIDILSNMKKYKNKKREYMEDFSYRLSDFIKKILFSYPMFIHPIASSIFIVSPQIHEHLKRTSFLKKKNIQSDYWSIVEYMSELHDFLKRQNSVLH